MSSPNIGEEATNAEQGEGGGSHTNYSSTRNIAGDERAAGDVDDDAAHIVEGKRSRLWRKTTAAGQGGTCGSLPSEAPEKKSAENVYAEEEKVEVAAVEEPIFYGSNAPVAESKSGAATSIRPPTNTNASTELPWHEAKQRGGRSGKRRGKRAVVVPPVSSAAPPDAGADALTEPDDWVAQKQRPRPRKKSRNAAAGQSAATGHCNTSESDSAPSSIPEPVAREDGEDRAAAIDVGPGREDTTPRPGAYHVAGTGGATNNASDPRSDAVPVGGHISAPQVRDFMVSATLVAETDDDIGDVYHAKPVTWMDAACHQYVRWALVGIALVAISLGVGLGIGLRPPPAMAAPTAVPTAAPTVSVMSSTAPTDPPNNSPTEYVWCPSDKVLPSDGAAGDYFGTSVAISGDTVVVGVYWDDKNSDWRDTLKGYDSGSAYVFTRVGTTWEEQAKLLPSDGAAGDYFGYSVAIHGDTVVVGVYTDDKNGDWRDTLKGYDSGSSYVFIRVGTSWEEQAKLLPSDGAAGDNFGYSVAIHGDTVVIGARLDEGNGLGSGSGSAYIFTRSETRWEEQAKLIASDGAAYAYFGESVAIHDNTLVVGADGDDNDNGTNSGSAYVFNRVGTMWEEQVKLLPSDGVAEDNFGRSVAIDDDTVVVGASHYFSGGRGSAYVFTRVGTTWEEQTKLLPNDGAYTDYFGNSVAIHGNTVVVGANEDGDRSGSVYVFTRTGSTWTQQKKLMAKDGAADDEFGQSVGLDGNTAIVGAWRDDNDNGEDSGSAHIIELC